MDSHRPTQTVDRAFSLLDVLADSERPLSLSEIAQLAELNISTCLRLLRTLEQRHYVERTHDSGAYRLGARIFALAHALESQLDIRSIARPVLERLSRVTGESAGLIVRQGNEGIVIERVVGPAALRHVTGLGHRGPLYCTSAGKALLAWGDPGFVERYLATEPLVPLTPTTIIDPARILVELDQVRNRGYALDFGEREVGLVGAAAPIRDVGDRLVGAIGCSGPVNRLTETVMATLVAGIVAGANEISIQLGWRPGTGIADRKALTQ